MNEQWYSVKAKNISDTEIGKKMINDENNKKLQADLKHAYEKACGKKIPVEITERRAGDIATSYADPSKAKKLLGWEATADLQQMCADSWRFTKQNPNGM